MKKHFIYSVLSFLFLLLIIHSPLLAVQYYLSSATGNDSNSGTSINNPWKTFNPVNTRTFQPGDIINFACGSVWDQALNISGNGIRENPIIYQTYGAGAKPMICIPNHGKHDTVYYKKERQYTELSKISTVRITGKWNILDGFYIRDAPFAAVELVKGADHNIIRNCEISNSGLGISAYSKHNLFTHNYVHDLIMIRNTPASVNRDDDYGAVAFWMWAGNNEISYNKAVNCYAHSYDYGTDGGFVEFLGRGTTIDSMYIHHNNVENCDNSCEVSGPSHNSLFAYNIFINTGAFGFHMWTHDSDKVGFRIENNLIVNSKTQAIGFWGNAIPNPKTLMVKNNIFYLTNSAAITDKTGFSHQNNVYYLNDGKNSEFEFGKGEVIADPMFVNPSQKDLRLILGRLSAPAMGAHEF